MTTIHQPPCLNAASARVAAAKDAYTTAAQAAIAGDVTAPALCDAALIELKQAQQALRTLTEPDA